MKSGLAMDSYEYLSVYLWDRIRRNEAEQGFNRLKSLVPAFTPFANLEQLLERCKQDRQARDGLLDEVLHQLIQVYQTHHNLHPPVILLVLMLIWPDMEGLYQEYKARLNRRTEAFSEIYWFFIEEIGRWDLSIWVSLTVDGLKETVLDRIDPERDRKKTSKPRRFCRDKTLSRHCGRDKRLSRHCGRDSLRSPLTGLPSVVTTKV